MPDSVPPDNSLSATQDPREALKKRISRHDHYYDSRNSTFTTRKTLSNRNTRPPKSKSRKVIDVRRYIDHKSTVYRTAYAILSEPLRDVFLEIQSHAEDADILRLDSEVKKEDLVYAYEPLQKRLEEEKAKKEPNLPLCQDIETALALADEDVGKDMQSIASLTAAGRISFDLLGYIFTANTLVYSYDTMGEQDAIYQVRTTSTMSDGGKKWLVVSCNVIRGDGRGFGVAKNDLNVEEFHGLKPLVELPAYPLKYHEDADGMYKKAVERGKRIATMASHAYHSYSSQAIREKEGDPGKLERFYTSGRVMISPSAFVRYNPDNLSNARVFRQVPVSKLTEEQYALCSPRVLGFSFGAKSWGEFAMDRLQPVEWNDNAFEFLVLAEEQKTLIYNLVRQHSLDATGFDDFIKNKGHGLIGLLAGSPGCGKTLTAEAVAETTHRPLYTISSGELGIEPAAMELKLLRALDLAQLWNAVILIDEAEVFLQQRQTSDLQRNALVAIFLRQLEYYQGIMILTTNMVEECDVAFESRIHFLVHYPDLDPPARRKIWTIFTEKASLTVSEEDLETLANYEMNGRQIKNAVRTARTLALARGTQQMTTDDVKAVLRVLQNWRKGGAGSTSVPV
ncbi:P-loop containing nucleoside triphosphate hydrolase protein [Flagelloscypha sp. PMI_526]|nr:P-loop containing nucleoside triphosphate hydrolase protein [Flagelloscypha sp. PMI_526]